MADEELRDSYAIDYSRLSYVPWCDSLRPWFNQTPQWSAFSRDAAFDYFNFEFSSLGTDMRLSVVDLMRSNFILALYDKSIPDTDREYRALFRNPVGTDEYYLL